MAGMRRKLFALLVLAAATASGEVSVVRGTVCTRDNAAAKSLSGITYAGGDLFYAVADDSGTEGGLYTCTIELGPEGTNIVSFSICSTNDRVKLGTASDLEGVARDPATGHVWATDEGGRSIREYDPATGEKIRSLAIPAILSDYRYNFGFEALTISGDGLALWTANEEALECDGAISSHDAGTTVRLAKFTRRSVRDVFSLEAMYAYTTDPWKNAYDYKGTARCGVAGLCALPDGSLLVLERELNFSNTSGMMALALGNYLGWKLYRVERPEAATDVKDWPSLADGGWTGTEKTLLASDGGLLFATGNFEGVCLGPRLANGDLSVLLLSDSGDGYSRPMVYPLVLSGLDVHTLDFPEPAASLGADAAASLVGSNYRFLAGARVESALSGAAAAAAHYAANGSSVPLPQWSLACAAASGEGAVASFEVSGDDTLRWTGLSAAQPVATKVLGCDTFEEYAVGASVDHAPELPAWNPGDPPIVEGPSWIASELRGWSGNRLSSSSSPSATVVAGTPVSGPAGLPMAAAPHERILSASFAKRTYPSPSCRNQILEMVVRAPIYFNVLIGGDDPLCEDENRSSWIAMLHVEDEGGKPLLYHGDGNGAFVDSTLDAGPFASGEWIRLGFLLDVTTDPGGRAFVEVSINGTPVSSTNGLVSPSNPVPADGGTWHLAGPDTTFWGGITYLALTGPDGFAVDDVLLAEADFPTESTPGYVRADGVPSDWMRARGLDPVFGDLSAPTAIRDGDRVYTLGDAFTAGVDPDGTDPLREAAVELLPDGRVRIVLNGLRPDNASAYAVYGAADLAALSTDDPSRLIPGAFQPDSATGRTVWTSDAAVGDAAFFRVKASR